MRARRRFLIILSLGCVAAAGFGSSAHAASTVTLAATPAGGELKVSGDSGANDVAAGVDPGNAADYRISDSSGISDPLPPGCVRVSATAIRCPAAGVTRIKIELGDGDDQFKVSSGSIPEATDLFVNGGEGSDTMRGRNGPGSDSFFGEGGDDTIFGEGGFDTIFGGPGNDELDGGAGNDIVSGEEGNDIVSGGTGKDFLHGGDGKDIVNGLADDDKLFGDKGNDKLSGGSGNDKGIGGAGKDSFNGGGGKDKGKAEKLTGVEK